MELLEAYKAMADESRLRIVHALRHGYLNVQELTSILGVSQSTISHHLKILQGAGIARSFKEGTWTYYGLARGEGLPASITKSFLEISAAGSNGHRETFARDDEAVTNILARRREQTHRFFESVAETWKEIRREMVQGDESYLEPLIAAVPPTASLLDVGCGSGLLLERLLPRPGATIGVDYSPAMLTEARQNLGPRADQVDFRLGYLEHLPVADGSIEVTVASMVLHHIAQPMSALQEIFRVLKPGGRLVVADLVHHTNEYMRERFADLWLGFETKEFSAWLADAGFTGTSVVRYGERQEVFVLQTMKPEGTV